MNNRPDDIRKWHFLRRNHSTRCPNRILCVDTETTPEDIPGKPNRQLHTLKLWCAVGCRIGKGGPYAVKDYSGTTRAEFLALLRCLARDKQSLWIFMHNAGFDMTTLRIWEAIEDGTLCFSHKTIQPNGATVKRAIAAWRGVAVIDDPPTILKMRIAGTAKTITFVDTFNYFRCSLKALGESVGIPKLDMPTFDSDDKSLKVYCMNDASIVFAAVTKLMAFVREHDLGVWSYTAPGQAFAAYKHRFMDNDILIHGSKYAIEIEREAYMGGRNQCMYVGRIISERDACQAFYRQNGEPLKLGRIGPVHVCDIQSCYPSVMINRPYPVKLKSYDVSPTPKQLADAVNSTDLVIARVRLDTPQAFPVRRNGRTFFARGRYVTTLCGPELSGAFDCDAIKAVEAMAIYAGEPIFSSYVNYFYTLRNQYKSENNRVYADLCKVFLNSLFGKFGQRSYSWVDCPEKVAPQPWGLWSEGGCRDKPAECYRSLAWMVQRESKIGEAFNSAPAIAAYVTSYARELVQWYLDVACPANCYYIDTDSLHVNEEGYENLVNCECIKPYKLGKLKLVEIYETAEYRGLKDYTVGDIDVIAGLKRKSTKLPDGSREQLNFQRLRSILAGRPPMGVTVEKVRITPGQHTPIGTLDPSGTLYTPILDE